MVKPFKIFIIFFLVLTILVIISLITPREGIRVGDITIRYPSILELFNLDTIKRPDEFALAPELVLLEQFLDSIAISEKFTAFEDTLKTDSLIAEFSDTIAIDTSKVSDEQRIRDRDTKLTADILKGRLISIETADSDFTALSPFFNALATGEAAKMQIRILHYGDSQIEGDRITSFLRSRLQSRFGGKGVGLLHAVPHSFQPGTVRQTISSNWQQVLMPDLKRGAVAHKFGLQGGYSRFTSSRRTVKGGFTEAWVSIQRIGPRHSSARNFNRCKIYYGYNPEPFMLSINYSGATQDAEMIAPTYAIKSIAWDIPISQNNIQIDFKGDSSPLVYGISLESPVGVIVDNIAIRGSSGTDFTRADEASLTQAMHAIDAKLIILQFGVNVVPNIVESYQYYENQMYQQIIALKRAKPDAAILLVGVSDMSRREGGRYVSYPNIELIRDAQRNAALRAGAAFWDCYKAMGGRNSMPAWVYADPPLASKDFVHFTYRGSNLIAEMFYSALMEAYYEYKKNYGID